MSADGHADQVAKEEARARRLARRHGLAVRKSRSRDPLSFDYGRYWLVEADSGWRVLGLGPLHLPKLLACLDREERFRQRNGKAQ